MLSRCRQTFKEKKMAGAVEGRFQWISCPFLKKERHFI
jgi:hypothetical protein